MKISSPSELTMRNMVMDFLASIGISCRVVDVVDGFLPNIAIVRGALEVDPHCSVGNILHEAAHHIAIAPKKYRDLMDGNLFAGMREMLSDISNTISNPDDPRYRAAIQCSDPEATAWAFAAGRHIGLPDEVIIENESYNGDGAEIRCMLQMRAYTGINGLSHAGFCATKEYGAFCCPVYPELAMWLQH